MADRYLITGGGSVNWNSTGSWSATDGGATGASVPVAGDNVFLTASSGSGTLTVNVSSACADLTATGYTGTLAGSSALAVGGSWVSGSGMTLSYSGTLTFNSTATGKTITTNGVSFSGNISINGAGGGWSQADALTTSGSFSIVTGTYNFSGFNLTTSAYIFSGSSTKTINYGSENIYITGTGTVFNWSRTGTTMATATGGSVILTNTSSTGRTVSGNTLTNPLGKSLLVTGGTGADTYTTAPNIVFEDVDFTGFTGSITQAFSLRGNLTLGSGMSGVDHAQQITFVGSTGTQTITSNGVVTNLGINISAVGSTVSLADNLDLGSRFLVINKGTFTDNGKNISCSRASLNSTSGAITATLSGTTAITTDNTVAGGFQFSVTTVSSITFTHSGTIKLTSTSSNPKVFSGGGLSYNSVWFAGAGSGVNSISGSNSFAELKLDSAPKTVSFASGTTNTITALTGFSGTAGNLITLGSATPASKFTLKKSGAVFSGDYLSVSDMTGTDGYKWFMGKHSTNGGNNSGVAFDTPQGASQMLI